MGRIMSFDQDGRRVRDFDKSEHDFLRMYGRTPEEVMDENAKLVVKLNAEHIVRQNVEIENANLRQQLAYVTESIGRVEERCAKLREYAKLMHDHIKDCCDYCDEWYCSNWDEDNECCRFDTMMRVCGIEVD